MKALLELWNYNKYARAYVELNICCIATRITISAVCDTPPKVGAYYPITYRNSGLRSPFGESK